MHSNHLFSDGYANRSAFVLNANAKSVSDRTISKLVDLIPAGDLFYSRSLAESENYYRTILRRGYSRVFSGGGDGTMVNAINTIRRLSKGEHVKRLPALGVLKLGTGNAMASIVGAKNAWTDVHHIVKGGAISAKPMSLVECDNGELAPFAGIGLDGEILNDYCAMKNEHRGKVTERLMSSVFGYVWAGLSRTLARHIRKDRTWIKVYSSSAAYKIVQRKGEDAELALPAGSLLYEGPACMVALGSIPYYGYRFQMFPFVTRIPDHVQLRICAAGLLPILTHVYPGIWQGTFRHRDLHDFLVRDVVIECQDEMPYQIGGDAAGYRRRLSFKVAPRVIQIAELAPDRLLAPKSLLGLLPAPSFARS